MQALTAGYAKLTSRSGAADANQGGRADYETFLPNRSAAHIAYFVYAGVKFPLGRVYLRKVLAGLHDERRHVLPLESERRALRVVLVVAAGRALARAGDDRGELPLKLRDPAQCLVAIGVQPRLNGTRVSHLRHLSLKWQ